jgi:hypothetical protein
VSDETAEEFDPITDALGVYVGPADYGEVVRALTVLPPGSELVVRIDNRESLRPGDGVAIRSGYPEHLHVDDGDEGERDAVVIHKHEEPLGCGVMYRDAPLVLWLTRESDLDADRFDGGIRLRSSFGAVIDFVVWHGVMHVTESGDVAPGFGDFRATTKGEGDDEG